MEEMVQRRISAESDMNCYMMRVRAEVPGSEEGGQWSFLEELGPGLSPEDDGVASVSTTFSGSPPLSFLPSFRTGRSDSGLPRTPPLPTQAALLRLGLKFCLGTRSRAASRPNLGDCPTVTKVRW